MTTPLLADRLGTFAAGLRLSELPEDVVEVARCAIVHNLSVAAAGRPVVAVHDDWARPREVRPGTGARALLSGIELAPADAAFHNGCLLHARAQDDTYFPGLTHVGAATTPAVLALAERRRASLGDVLVALVAGYEVAGAVGVAAAKVSTARGFRASGIYGPFGAAAGAAKMLGLDAAKATHAVSIASSFSAGTNQTWVGGSSEWQLQLGNASRSGLEAATLASFGATGSVDAFEGADGFFAAYVGDAAVADGIGHDLGEVWRTREVTFKAHPVCAILQSPVDAAIELRSGADGSELTAATLRLNPAEAAYPGTDGMPPFTDPGSALMSASYCLGVALEHGLVTADDLNRSAEAHRRDLASRVTLVADADLGPREFVLEAEWSNGHRGSARQPGGRRPGPWSRRELEVQLTALQPEVPGIDLAVLPDIVWGDLEAPAADLVSAMVLG
ncbi:MmgE/PrpD family protein [Nocardioides caldifontis]|uniref:MmgE/PrpD family protein n=1 Tax=Nocardioides caldifontis TaxID=2588938 RepID=UPI0011DFD74E|nr:MmgE/PrpD family protein [Nocardioides caldifontis]